MRRITSILVAMLIALTLGKTAFAAPKRGNVKQIDRALALGIFARLKAMGGKWRAQSTKGWSESEEFRTIAKGSVVVAESLPSANASRPGMPDASAMLTVFHMDGDRLLLTHYCEAGNQPRMVATAIEDAGRSVRFTFVDATNLSSPRTGHMHSLVLTFIDRDHFSERWSWYQGGREEWMETIQRR